MWAKVKSIYFNHPSQGTSTNYYLILGLRDKAAPPTSQQINKFPSEATEEPSDTVIHLLLYWMYAVRLNALQLTFFGKKTKQNKIKKCLRRPK